MAYIFSLILIFTSIAFAVYYNRQSKPSQLHLNPMLARSNMLEHYLEIEKMPAGVNKLQAYKQWQQDCERLKHKLSKQKAKNKVVDRQV